ncbi:x globin [Sinocyclocheilus rhinocerous]|uniref:x globin n=1 Tax=Sinocyclocheilus rhinocerous TaxID=307959 RepID=UPI0007B81B43|nr:PREDICTED: neuroglobin-like [Sinocyclocheilus rhinocerous]
MGCAISGSGLTPRTAESRHTEDEAPARLTPDHIQLIRESWKVIQEDIAKVGIIMFVRVMSFIEKSVARLDQLERLETLARELGRSHFRYNAPPKYYGYVGAEFICAVRPVLKDRWTPELEQAWQTLFQYVTAIMEDGYLEEERSRRSHTLTSSKQRPDKRNTAI